MDKKEQFEIYEDMKKYPYNQMTSGDEPINLVYAGPEAMPQNSIAYMSGIYAAPIRNNIPTMGPVYASPVKEDIPPIAPIYAAPMSKDMKPVNDGEESTIFCTECGAKIRATSNFCSECGALVTKGKKYSC